MVMASRLEKEATQEIGGQGIDEYSKYNKIVHELKEELQHASQEREDLRHEKAHLTESFERQDLEKRKLETDLQELNDQCYELETANQEMAEHVDGLRQQNAVLEQQNQQLLQEGNANVSLLQENKELLSQLQVLTSANQDLRQKVVQSEQTIKELRLELDRMQIETSVRQRRELLTLGSNFDIVNIGADTDDQSPESVNVESPSMRSELQRLQDANSQLSHQLEQVKCFQEEKDERIRQLEADREQDQEEIKRLQQDLDKEHEAGASAALWKQRHDEAIKQFDQFKMQQVMKDRISQQQERQFDNEKKEIEIQLQKANTKLDELRNETTGRRPEDLSARIQQLETENEDLQLQLRFRQLEIDGRKDEPGSNQELIQLREETQTLKDRLEQQDHELNEVLSQDEQRAHQYQKEKETLKQRIAELERSLAEASNKLKILHDDDGDRIPVATLATQEYELKQQFEEKYLELRNELVKTRQAFDEAEEGKRVMREMYEQQLKTRPVPKARSDIQQQLRNKIETLTNENEALKERNTVLYREREEKEQQVCALSLQKETLNRRVNSELDERNNQAGRIKSLEQEQSRQAEENEQLKQQFVTLSDYSRGLHDQLDDAKRLGDIQLEKNEELEHHLAVAQQQINVERQRRSADVSRLQQQQQMLEAELHQEQELSQRRQQQQQCTFKDAYDKMVAERDVALRYQQQVAQQYDDLLTQYEMIQQQKEEIEKEHRDIRDHLGQTTAELYSEREVIEGKEEMIRQMEANIKDKEATIKELQEQANQIRLLEEQSKVWKTDFEAEREAREKACKDRDLLLQEKERLCREAQDAAAYFRDENRHLTDEIESLRNERLHELHRRRADTGYQQHGNRPPSNFGHDRYDDSYRIPNVMAFPRYDTNEFQPQSESLQSGPTYKQVICPLCQHEFPDMDTFNIHANECIQ